MATLWAVEGPHRTVGNMFVEFCRVPAKSGEQCIVSRAASPGLHLDHDPKVSREQHARVWFEEGAFYLSEVDSNNGTFLRRGDDLVALKRGEKVRLDNMDEFVVGDTLIVFRVDEPSQSELNENRAKRHERGIRDALSLPRKLRDTQRPTV